MEPVGAPTKPQSPAPPERVAGASGIVAAKRKAKSRSGTIWSTAEYAAGGYDPTLSVRLHAGYKARLQRLAKDAGLSVTALLEQWVRQAEDRKGEP